MKGQKGITLVALVITVIIMLILAGVAISVLTVDGGLFDTTRDAADAYNNASNYENELINKLMQNISAELNELNKLS